MNKMQELLEIDTDINNYRHFFLDTETSGLKGKLNLVQYSTNETDEVFFIRPSKEPEKMLKLLEELNNPKNIFFGWNILSFDLGKLYEYYKPKLPFQAVFVDLWLKTRASAPFKYYPLQGKKMVALERIPVKYSKQIEEVVVNRIKRLSVPSMQVKVTHQKVKENRDLVTLIFSVTMSTKLKVIAPLFSEREQLSIEDAFQLPAFKENMKLPYTITEEEQLYYDALFEANEKILDNPKSIAWQYAADDIYYLKENLVWLIKNGNKIAIDHNDICGHAIAYTKFIGFGVNVEETKIVKEELNNLLDRLEAKHNFNLHSPPQRLYHICKHFHPMFDDFPLESTDSKKLKALIEDDFLTEKGVELAKDLLAYTPASQKLGQLEVFNDILHPDFKVIGTSTGRMSGTGGVNFQGVSREASLRSLVYALAGGDFDNLEIVIAATFFNDEKLLEIAKDGDMHTLTASLLLNEDYYFLMNEVKPNPSHELYKRFKEARNMAKGLNFSILYFAEAYRVAQVLGYIDELDYKTMLPDFSGMNVADKIDMDLAIKKELAEENLGKENDNDDNDDEIEYEESDDTGEKALKALEEEGLQKAQDWMDQHFFKAFPSLQETRKAFYDKFCTADFTNWTSNSVAKMSQHVTDIWGNTRYIVFEASLANFFWQDWTEIAAVAKEDTDGLILRRKNKGQQSLYEAIHSACLGAASKIQKSVYRQLGNFPIQSSGATLTKLMMANLFMRYELGLMNVHDELIVSDKSYSYNHTEVRNYVQSFINKACETIPYLKMEWKKIDNWSEK